MNSRIRSFGLLTILGAALLTTGCTHNLGGADRPIVISNETTGIAVNGHGEVPGTPDIAVVALGVEITAASVGKAREDAAQAANRVMAALENNGVARQDIQTSGLNISPQYEYPPNQQPLIVGYQVTNSLTVKVRRIDNTSRIIDEAVKAGGNEARVHNIQFEIDDPSKLREAAREKAVSEALTKAKQLAELSGVDLGTPISVEEVGFSAPSFPMSMRGMAEADSSTPISPGQNIVTVDVRVRWSIDG